MNYLLSFFKISSELTFLLGVLKQKPLFSCIDWVKFQRILTPKATCVDLWHTRFLWVLRGAEVNSIACPAQKWSECLKIIVKSKMAAATGLRYIYIHIFLTKQGKNLNETCFCSFSYVGNPSPYSVLK